MTRGVKVRLVVFVILSVIGLVYLGGSYLGIVDRVLGRGYQVDVLLPTSGGLYEGSEVTYRGVKVGEVAKMTVESDGLRVRLRLKDGARIPAGAPVYVHNLIAVGEQYLDFEPS
ncbi:MAG TPA: MlaD family protein, partial [Aeromicrobium sp.]|nr:MlaD family protein [Aeromicrobium sp.]